MFDVKYKGLKIEVTLSASRELLKGNLDLDDVLNIRIPPFCQNCKAILSMLRNARRF